MDWFYSVKGERKGPVTLEALKAAVVGGQVPADSLVWNASMGETWARVADVPALSSWNVMQDEARKREEFVKKLAEKKIADAERRKRSIVQAAIAIPLVILALAGLVVWIKGGPRRHWGVNAKNPVGAFAPLDKHFMEVARMDREDLTELPLLKSPGARMVRYTNPRNRPSENVTAQGNITLSMDKDGRLQSIVALYPTPGIRGSVIANASVICLFMRDYWEILGSSDRRSLPLDKIPPAEQAAISLSLAELSGGTYYRLRDSRVNGYWIEYGQDGIYTLIYLEAAPK